MKKVIALSSVLALSALGMACGDAAPANNATNKPANTNVAKATPAPATNAAPSNTAPATNAAPSNTAPATNAKPATSNTNMK